jgi:hypothetical protein
MLHDALASMEIEIVHVNMLYDALARIERLKLFM